MGCRLVWSARLNVKEICSYLLYDVLFVASIYFQEAVSRSQSCQLLQAETVCICNSCAAFGF